MNNTELDLRLDVLLCEKECEKAIDDYELCKTYADKGELYAKKRLRNLYDAAEEAFTTYNLKYQTWDTLKKSTTLKK